MSPLLDVVAHHRGAAAFSCLALFALAAPAAAGPGPSCGLRWQEPESRRDGPASAEPCAGARADEQDAIAWFQGSWSELLAAAGREQKLVFVDFWAEWCGPCRMFSKHTLADEAVAAALDGLLCYQLEIDEEENAPIAERFAIQTIPALVFLEPDGARREVLTGYLTPEVFLKELARVQRNEGTLSALEARIAARPDDLDARYALAKKLEGLGQVAAARAEFDAILRLDPDGRSAAARRVKLDLLLEELYLKPELGPLYAFLAGESEPEILFTGWYAVWQIEGHLVKNAESAVLATRHRRAWVAAARTLWGHTPGERRVVVGNNIAWHLYEAAAALAAPDLSFALDVARVAAGLAPDDANVVDTLACCLFALGHQEEALRQVRRCIELQPENPEWRKRLEDFESGGALPGGDR